MTSLFYSSRIFCFILFIALIILTSCSDDKPTEPEKETLTFQNITIGETTQEIIENIEPLGGTIKVSNQTSAINGLEIIVPQKGYNERKTYTISSSPINGHKFGEYFNPVSPMITIKNGGGYSETPIQIKVPIQKNDDEFLMGFFFNELTDNLEALPTIEITDSYVIVETRHFELSSITSKNSLGKASEINPVANLIISSIKETILSGQSVISSGFTPGIDDWEFINYGSYISPGGHCAGQSMTAMWYFYEKKLAGEQPLFHRFDSLCNTENPVFLWQDNPLGYRLSSTVQEDANWGDWISALNFQSIYPKHVWFTFITAMLVTGEPQSVIIRNSTDGGGHAMIVYKINVSEGSLYVADPNYPNNKSADGTTSIRKITFNGDKFLPYPSFAKVGDPGKEYDQIAFYSKTSTFNWEKISQRFLELENKTIGNDRFPQYDLFVRINYIDFPLTNGLEVSEDSLVLFCKSDYTPSYLPGTDGLQKISIYNSNGYFISSNNNLGIAKVKLNSGVNKFGICIYSNVDNSNSRYNDFKWINVNSTSEPSPDYNKCGISIYCGANHVYSTPEDSYETTNNKVGFGTWQGYTGGFSGSVFTASFYKLWDSPTNPLEISGSITAVFNGDFSEILTFNWSETSESQNIPNGISGSSTTTFSGKNIPLDTFEWGTVYQVIMEETCDHIESFTDTQSSTNGLSYTMPEYWCNGDSKIYISFSKE